MGHLDYIFSYLEHNVLNDYEDLVDLYFPDILPYLYNQLNAYN